MTKVELDLGIEVIKYTFEKLPTEGKIRVVEELEKESRKERWAQVINKVRGRVAGNPIPQREINRICEIARQELYDKRTKNSSGH